MLSACSLLQTATNDQHLMQHLQCLGWVAAQVSTKLDCLGNVILCACMLIAFGTCKSRTLRANLPALGTPECDQADLQSLHSCCQTTVCDLALTCGFQVLAPMPKDKSLSDCLRRPENTALRMRVQSFVTLHIQFAWNAGAGRSGKYPAEQSCCHNVTKWSIITDAARHSLQRARIDHCCCDLQRDLTCRYSTKAFDHLVVVTSNCNLVSQHRQDGSGGSWQERAHGSLLLLFQVSLRIVYKQQSGSHLVTSTLHATKSLGLSKEHYHLPPTECYSQHMQYMVTAVCSVSEGVTVGSALSPSMSSSFTKALGLGRTASQSSSPRSSDASMTRKNKLWPFSKARKDPCCGRCSHYQAACGKLTAVSVLTCW